MKAKVCIPAKVTQLSRSEVMTLLYDKMTTIRDEADTLVDGDAVAPKDLSEATRRLKRIAIEAKRAAALIETYEVCARAGHCLHCGEPYDAHNDQRTDEVRASVPSTKQPRCMVLKRFFESMEIETYQGVQIVETSA